MDKKSDVFHGLEQLGAALPERGLDSELAGRLKSDILGINGMHLAVCQGDLDVGDRVAGEGPAAMELFSDPFFNGRNEGFGDDPSLDSGFE